MMKQITINFDSDNGTVLNSILAILDNTLPYMVDNVEIEWVWED